MQGSVVEAEAEAEDEELNNHHTLLFNFNGKF